jgi:hypothetical protein
MKKRRRYGPEKRVAEISATLSFISNHSMIVMASAVIHMGAALLTDGSKPRGARVARRPLLKPFALVHYGRI